MTIDFLGVESDDQAAIRSFFEQLITVDADKDTKGALALLSKNVFIEVEGVGRLDRKACEQYLLAQASNSEESKIDYPTLYVEFSM